MWTRPTLELMLIEYGQHDNLYNVRHPDYKDRVKRSKSLYAIQERLKEVDASLTIEGIKTKIHGLRSQYLKEVNLVKGSKRSGAGRDDVYVPKLWCFSLMEFLGPYVSTRPSSSSISDNNKKNESSDVNVCEEDSLLNDSLPGTSQSSTLQASTPSIITSAPCSSSNKRKLAFSEQIEGVKRLVTKRLTEVNEYEWISKQVDFEFRRITNEEVKSEMAYKIQTVLREGRIKAAELSRGTTEVPARDMQQNSNNSLCSDPDIFSSDSNLNRTLYEKSEICNEDENIKNNDDYLLPANDAIWLRFEFFSTDDASTSDKVVRCRQCKMILKYDDTTKEQLGKHKCCPIASSSQTTFQNTNVDVPNQTKEKLITSTVKEESIDNSTSFV